ncbi:MAG: toll/interleukin-1 receptor domain-containing protein [Hyphomicrobium sp.]|uniref:toll/interleukin-1 receptor domain-containing protein n=1 Tax=Hyphomicrobium sp. TaxID=82 RepID=UPI003D147ABB
MAGGIFISYRRDDSRHAAGRLYQHLVQRFPRDALFMDIDSIEPGLDFANVLQKTVADCDAIIAVIGPGWTYARDEAGARRLDNPDDFVRLEIEAALRRDVRVVPVLVDGASLPRAEELPETMRSLVRRNAVRLTHEKFGTDADVLAEALAKFIVPAPAPAKSGWFMGGARAKSEPPARKPTPTHPPKAAPKPAAQTPDVTAIAAASAEPMLRPAAAPQNQMGRGQKAAVVLALPLALLAYIATLMDVTRPYFVSADWIALHVAYGILAAGALGSISYPAALLWPRFRDADPDLRRAFQHILWITPMIAFFGLVQEFYVYRLAENDIFRFAVHSLYGGPIFLALLGLILLAAATSLFAPGTPLRRNFYRWIAALLGLAALAATVTLYTVHAQYATTNPKISIDIVMYGGFGVFLLTLVWLIGTRRAPALEG